MPTSAACASAVQVPTVGVGVFLVVTCFPISIDSRSGPMAATKSPRLWYCLVSGLLIASQLPHASAASKECFDQNGNQLSSDQALPCNEDLVRDGPCCAPGTICLSNGLCKNADALVNRFTDTFKPFCTDGTWTTSNCFDGCNSGE